MLDMMQWRTKRDFDNIEGVSWKERRGEEYRQRNEAEEKDERERENERREEEKKKQSSRSRGHHGAVTGCGSGDRDLAESG